MQKQTNRKHDTRAAQNASQASGFIVPSDGSEKRDWTETLVAALEIFGQNLDRREILLVAVRCFESTKRWPQTLTYFRGAIALENVGVFTDEWQREGLLAGVEGRFDRLLTPAEREFFVSVGVV